MRIQHMAGLLLLSASHSAFAEWVAHSDFSSCPRKYYPNLSGQEGGFATESACQARVAQAKRGDSAVCIRYTCKQSGEGSSGSASTGNALDDAYARAMAASQNSNQMMQASGLYLGAKLLEGALQGPTPEQQAAAEAQRQYEAEQAQLRAIEAENRKNQLLAEMQDVEGSGELQLMTGDDDGSGGSQLALMDDDGNTRGIMGKRKTPKTQRNQPPAVRKNPGPYRPGAGPKSAEPAGNGPLAMNFDDDEPQQEQRPAPQPRPEPESFNRGVLDGQACNQRSPGALCGGLAGEASARCLNNYNRGYDQGARENERRLTARGTEQGRRDRGGNNAALSYPDARGSCGNIFIQAYNNAFR